MHRTNPVPRSAFGLILLGLAIGPLATARAVSAAEVAEGTRPPEAVEAAPAAEILLTQEQAPAPRPQAAPAPAAAAPPVAIPAGNLVVVPIGASRTVTMKGNLPIRTVVNS